MDEWGEWRGAKLLATTATADTVLHRPHGQLVTMGQALRQAIETEPRLTGGDVETICDLIDRGRRERTASRTLARELRTLVPLSTQDSIDVAAYLFQRQSVELANERAFAAGLGPRFTWRWGGNLDDPPHHKCRDGMVLDWSAPMLDDQPIGIDDLPGMAPRCGCRAQFILDLEDD